MNDVDLKLIGDDEILAAFRELDFRTQHKRLHQVLNNAGNIPKKAIQEVVRVRRTKIKRSGKKWHPPGTARKNIVKVRGKNKKRPTLFVGPRATSPVDYSRDAFYLKIWDLYSPGKKRVVSAMDRSLPRAQQEIFNSMRTILQRAWNKHVRR